MVVSKQGYTLCWTGTRRSRTVTTALSLRPDSGAYAKKLKNCSWAAVKKMPRTVLSVKARHLQPDLILLDFSMPAMTGADAAAVLTAGLLGFRLVRTTSCCSHGIRKFDGGGTYAVSYGTNTATLAYSS